MLFIYRYDLEVTHVFWFLSYCAKPNPVLYLKAEVAENIICAGEYAQWNIRGFIY